MVKLAIAASLMLLPACLVDNQLVGAPGGTSPESPAVADREGWCQSTCERIVACPAADWTDVATCSTDCQDDLDSLVGHGEACDAAAERFMTCLDALTCDELNNRLICGLSEEERAACELDDSGETSPPQGVSPSSGPVTCGEMGGLGPAPGAATFHCEWSASDCSDGGTYETVCNLSPSGQGLCTCVVDDEPTHSFWLPELVCPSSGDINVGCDFWLAQGALQVASCDGVVSTGAAPAPDFGCTTEFHACSPDSGPDHQYTVACAADGGVPSCTCRVDGEIQGSFNVPDGICPVDGEADLRRINAGCGWYLDPP